MKLLTNLIFEPKGKHDSASAYNIKDTVMSADGSRVYFALQDVPVGIPLDDEDYWKLQIDLSASKSAMDDAIASFGNYAKAIGTRVKGETAKASGNPVTFLPDADSLLMPVTVLEPQQEGSGDPYPAGGGRNLITFTGVEKTNNGVTFSPQSDGRIKVTGTATARATYDLCGKWESESGITFKPGVTYNQVTPIKNLEAVAYGYTNGTYEQIRSEVLRKEYTDVYIYLQVGTGVTIDDYFAPTLTADGWSDIYIPYSNIRPFIGYDALWLTRAGKNLLENTRNTTEINGIKFTVNPDGSVTANGTATANATFIVNDSNDTLKLENGDYILSGCPAGGNANSGYFAVVSGVSSDALSNAYDVGSGVNIPFSNNGGYYNVAIGIRSGVTVSNLTFKPMIRLASDPDSSYVPYQSNTYTVQIGQTVYGFRYDWLTGKGWIEWVGQIMSETDNWNMTGSVFYQPLPENIDTTKSMCSHYGFSIATVNNASSVGKYDLLGSIRFNKGNFNTVDEWESNLSAQKAAGTPVQVIWKLKTPIEIQLPPTIISAADPEQTNTLYGDGSIEVEYVKPLHVSIEERVAAALAAMHE